MPGTMSRPPNGTYTHGVMLIDNTFGITMAMQFDGAWEDKMVRQVFIVHPLLADKQWVRRWKYTFR